ncbi:TPA: transposase [Escherichia coli]|uniref:transposase n=1 Tax=Escherichia coli TaxID=562 RepID=UPI0005A6571C|nr:transposase [Escherichia coli]EIT3897957.1 transposase [Escherichia coli]MDA6992733.1 transposase [Escherichia coli]QML63280.1 transposase [Escherichia coli]HAL9133074.1 transposase [Escherichia coli]HAL9281608.1 transposase [Escherichia coli]
MEIKTRRETRQTLAQWFEEKGFQKGFQKGYKEGLQKVRLAQRFLNKGMSREDVAEVTALSLAEIDKLINSN